jgi:hypothetical protein
MQFLKTKLTDSIKENTTISNYATVKIVRLHTKTLNNTNTHNTDNNQEIIIPGSYSTKIATVTKSKTRLEKIK